MVALVPELYVSDLAVSLAFYRALGFTVRYSRPEEGFAFIERNEAELMLEEPRGRVWTITPLEPPLGRGLNLQITVQDATALYAVVVAFDAKIVQPIEDRSYRRAIDEVRIRQFVVADPDGYLLRFSQILEVRVPPPATP